MRLDKLLSNLKYGSRKEVGSLIKQGFVWRNGEVLNDPGANVDPIQDEIRIGEDLVFYRDQVVLMMNKPRGVVSANADSREETVIDLLEEKYWRLDLNIAGRLDKDTEGLLLLTNSGLLLHEIISPKKDVFKTYLTTLRDPIGDLSRLEKGVEILDGKNQAFTTKPAHVEVIDKTHVRLSIQEGKYHQVRRMFEVLGNEVLELKREQIGSLALDPQLKPGEARELTDKEVSLLFSNSF